MAAWKIFQRQTFFKSKKKAQNVVNNIQFYLSPTSVQQQEGVGGCSSSVGNLVDDVRLNNNESNALTPQSDRKRKFGDMQPPSARSPVSWVRSAANLLGRVSKFRGINKQKGDLNAASWFIKAVDPSEEPGYYGIIKTPMDFTKIKRKLEDGEYESYTQFYDDMSLIKKNCYTYNPANHIARKDCDDVFNFFEGEYKKLLERWEKHHVSPQKRQRLEENGSWCQSFVVCFSWFRVSILEIPFFYGSQNGKTKDYYCKQWLSNHFF